MSKMNILGDLRTSSLATGGAYEGQMRTMSSASKGNLTPSSQKRGTSEAVVPKYSNRGRDSATAVPASPMGSTMSISGLNDSGLLNTTACSSPRQTRPQSPKPFKPPLRHGKYNEKSKEHIMAHSMRSKGMVDAPLSSPHRSRGTFSEPCSPTWQEPWEHGNPPSEPGLAFKEGCVGSAMRSPVWPRKDLKNARIPKIKPEVLARVQDAIQAGSYVGHEGTNLDVLLRRMDKDGSGVLEYEEVRRAFRRSLKIPPSLINDSELVQFFASVDKDGSGSIDIEEILAFMNWELPQPGKKLNAAYKMPQPKTHDIGWQDTYQDPVWTTNPQELTGKLRVPSNYGTMKWERKQPARMQSLDEGLVERLRIKLRSASYTYMLSHGGVDHVLRQNCNSSGWYDEDALRKLLRRVFRVPPQVISDNGIHSLFGMLDEHDQGGISIENLGAFIESS